MVYRCADTQQEAPIRFRLVVLARWIANAPLKMLDQYIRNLRC
jgi:hypothetical protein